MRLIDAEPLEEILRSRCAQCSNDYGSLAGAISGCLKLLQVQPTITPPPNDPLTLDELRQVDREPLWLQYLADGYGEWVLFEQVALEGICDFAVIGGTRQYNGKYGRDWLAYRHKPKEGAEA